MTSENDPERLLRAIPAEQEILPDGRASQLVIRVMILDASAQQARRSVYLSRVGRRFRHIADDAWYRRDAATCEPLHALADHAAARSFAHGYPHSIVSGSGPCEYWAATTTAHDFVPVVLAALDWQATGSRALVDWYLTSECGWRCAHHPDSVTAGCGSASCATADPQTRCDCTCGGENHGVGDYARPVPLAPLDWRSMPRLAWRPAPVTREAASRETLMTATRAPTFRAWLTQHQEARSYLGDFARDVQHDPDFPREPPSWARIQAYLHSVHAVSTALAAAEEAWRRYRIDERAAGRADPEAHRYR